LTTILLEEIIFEVVVDFHQRMEAVTTKPSALHAC